MSDLAAAADRDDLLVERSGPILTLTLNRPERSNALSENLQDRLREEFIRAQDDNDVWVIVLTGAGERAFCGGVDLKEMAANDAAGRGFKPPMNRPERNTFELITETYKPTIAAINGHAVAGGFELALACDIRIVSDAARLGLPEAKRGMGANFGTVLLPRLIPLNQALELLYTGDYISAEQALRLGVVNHVVPPAEVKPKARELAERIAENAPLTLRRQKELALKSQGLPLAAALRLDVGPNPYLSEDRAEGIRAFVEGRKPRWRGR